VCRPIEIDKNLDWKVHTIEEDWVKKAEDTRPEESDSMQWKPINTGAKKEKEFFHTEMY